MAQSKEIRFLDDFIYILDSRYRNEFYRRAMSILKDTELAETAVNDTWLHIAKYWKIQRKLYSFVIDGNPQGLGYYLVSILKSRALNLYSKRKARKEHEQGISFIPLDGKEYEWVTNPNPTPEEYAIHTETENELYRYLDKHSDCLNANAFRMYLNGWSYGEICEKMGISTANAHKRVSRARKACKEWALSQLTA